MKIILNFFTYLLIITKFVQSIQNDQLECSSIDDDHRVDCHPETWATPKLCEKRGCCWSEPNQANIGVPFCYYPSNYIGYQNRLEAIKDNDSQTIRLVRNGSSGFPNDYKFIQIKLEAINSYRAMVSVEIENEKRWIPPVQLDLEYVKTSDIDRLYRLDYDQTFVKVVRKETNQTIWQMNYRNLIISEQWLQAETHVPSFDLFGLSEYKDFYRKKFDKERKSYLLFNQGDAPSLDRPLYSSHPMYLAYEGESNDKILAHSVLLLNSNAMEVILSPGKILVWRSIGGQLTFYINLGNDPQDAISKYVSLVGKPYLPPFWSLGFQLSRYGYNNLTNMKQTYKRMIDNTIPLDTMWNDIDLYRDHNIFSIDNKSFDGMPQFVDMLHKENVHYVIMLDPGLGGNYTNDEYPALYDGLKKDVFLKSENGKPLRTRVWNKWYTMWVDFTNPNATDFWIEQIVKLHDEIEFDGLWVDMNSPDANSVDGSLDGCNWNDKYENPYFVPVGLDPLSKNTACMKSVHYAGIHYNIHNMYCYYEAKATYLALKKLRKRPFIISRSSFIGHGRFASKWSGDVSSTWQDLKMSIPNMLSMNIYGIFITGADICGFLGNTDSELCARWQSLGAFYTFSRNHNDILSIDQDPPSLGMMVIEATKYSLAIRYSLLSFLYTELYKGSTTGRPVVKALSLVFPNDKTTYDIETQFMWGDSIMIVPILEPNKSETNAYLPAGIWYDYIKQTIALKSIKEGKFLKMSIPIDRIGVLLRGGQILLTQEPKLNTRETRKTNFNIVVALNEHIEAEGKLYFDDGEDYRIEESKKFNFINFYAYRNVLFNKIMQSNFDRQPYAKSISILGVDFNVTRVTFNGEPIKFTYDSKISRLSIDQPIDLRKQFILVWI